jgi:hypothetical protein
LRSEGNQRTRGSNVELLERLRDEWQFSRDGA